MIPSDDSRYSDLFTEEVSEDRLRLLQDLEHVYRPASPPAHVGDRVRAAAVSRRAGDRPRFRPSAVRWLRPRMFAAAAACSLVLGSVLTYAHLQSPAPVSAQTILSRASTAGLSPDKVTHFTYALTASNGDTGTSEEWIEADSSGAPGRLALSNTVSHGGTSVPGLSERLVHSGDTVQVYDPATNTVTVSLGGGVQQPWETIVLGTYLTEKLSRSAQASSTSTLLQKLAPATPTQQSLDGVSVYALHLSRDGSQTIYIDAQSYIPRGADWSADGVSWQARLLRVDTMDASSAPANAFSLDAPATAKTVRAQSDKSDYPVDFGAAFASACHTTPEAFKAVLGNAHATTMLAACQQTNPSITADQLAAALLASAKTQLDAAVSAGQITAAQEADQLSRMQAKFGAMITTPVGGTGLKEFK